MRRTDEDIKEELRFWANDFSSVTGERYASTWGEARRIVRNITRGHNKRMPIDEFGKIMNILYELDGPLVCSIDPS